jgi:type IV secretory pathway VirJ component
MPSPLRRLALAAVLAFAMPALTVQAAAPADPVAALPLVEQTTAVPGDTLAVLYSGDGGWTGVDKGVANVLAKAGVPTVGVNSLRYFWVRRTPRQAAADLTAVIERYKARWHRSRVVLIGYSFGADALPIIVANLAPDVRAELRLTALVAVDHEGELQFHVSDWLNQSSPTAYTIAPVLAQLGQARLICIYGDQEKDDACPSFPPALIKQVKLTGGHHFDGDFDAVGQAIVKEMGR